MATGLLVFFGLATSFRLYSLVRSRRHERALKAGGAVEVGAANSTLLAILHVGYYAATLGEGLWRQAGVDRISLMGIVLYVLSALMLVWVWRELGAVWTVRLYLARDHVLNQNWLFRTVRHPNYYLNIIPELIGLALALHAFWTLLVGLPLYIVPLVIRIRQEETAMRERFAGY